ncbi:MAG: ankyrin repeat domain-containing protein [Acidimicrobiia bacterium]
MIVPTDDPRAVAAVDTIHAGDVDRLRQLLRDHPELTTAALGGEDAEEDCGMTRTLLHVVTDWPGHFRNGAAIVRLLVDAGADVNARFTGSHTETPLHWAASSDDVEVLDALLDAGADIEARGAVIGGRTPISDATAFGQWNAARRLLERGASTTFWEAATLGLIDRVAAAFGNDTLPSRDDITAAFWGACHGDQQHVAEYLLDHGADPNWIGWDNHTPLDAARRSRATELAEWLETRGGHSARRG